MYYIFGEQSTRSKHANRDVSKDEFCHEAFIRIKMLVAVSCEWQAETATLKQSENLHTQKNIPT